MTLSRSKVMVIVLIALAVVLLANAHLVYVSFASQPACVAHSQTGDAASEGSAQFHAAQSAC